MACFECSSSAMVINQLVPWITVGIFVASVALFCQLLKRDRRAWTSLVAVVVLMEELTLSLWLLINDVQILSPHFMGSSQKTESMVTPVFATPILTTSWLA